MNHSINSAPQAADRARRHLRRRAESDLKTCVAMMVEYRLDIGGGVAEFHHVDFMEFRIKDGPITMLSVGVTGNGKFKFIIAEGQSVDVPIPPTGNTNTQGVFKPDIRTFLKRWVADGPTHHFALGIGHRAGALKKIASTLGIECATVVRESAE